MKRWGRILFAILITLSFSGCSGIYTQPQPQCRLVREVHVHCRRGPLTIERTYTRDENIQAVMQYLRKLEPTCRATCDPERLLGDVYEIVLERADGSRSIYRQRADRFLSENAGPWRKISVPKDPVLYDILRKTPSDTASPA